MTNNGFIVVEKDNWKNASPEERDAMVFNTLKSIDSRLKALEGKKWMNSGCSFLGGIVGGIAAIFGMKYGG